MTTDLRQKLTSLAVSVVNVAVCILLVILLAWLSFVVYVQYVIDPTACATPEHWEIVAGRPDCPPEGGDD